MLGIVNTKVMYFNSTLCTVSNGSQEVQEFPVKRCTSLMQRSIVACIQSNALQKTLNCVGFLKATLLHSLRILHLLTVRSGIVVQRFKKKFCIMEESMIPS